MTSNMKQIGYKVPIGHTGPKIKKKEGIQRQEEHETCSLGGVAQLQLMVRQ